MKLNEIYKSSLDRWRRSKHRRNHLYETGKTNA